MPSGRQPGVDFRPDGYATSWAEVRHVRHEEVRSWSGRWLHQRIGQELWWARRNELDPPLDGAAAGRMLGINRSTLRSVEHGILQPRLSTVILVAGLTGRRLALVAG